jgi:hypothetical protein
MITYMYYCRNFASVSPTAGALSGICQERRELWKERGRRCMHLSRNLEITRRHNTCRGGEAGLDVRYAKFYQCFYEDAKL